MQAQSWNWKTVFMQFIEAVRLALQSLWGNKLRTILTLLGVIIGVASVITVVTLTNGAKQFVTSKINYLWRCHHHRQQNAADLHHHRGVAGLSRSAKTSPTTIIAPFSPDAALCQSVGAQRNRTGKVVRGSQSTTDTDIRGWTWTMPPISNLNIELGRAIHRGRRHHSAGVPSSAQTSSTTCSATEILWARKFALTARPTPSSALASARAKCSAEHG